MNLLIAPDSFKGSMRATELCALFQKHTVAEDLNIKCIPIADGGEGSLDAIAFSSGFERIEQIVKGPDFKERSVFYLWDDELKTAYIELAQAAGIEWIDVSQTNCLHTTTLGTGEQIRHALEAKAEKIVLFIGGSATNDAAMGIASALGIRFLGKDGNVLVPIGKNLTEVTMIDDSKAIQTYDIEFLVATDVDNPFYGRKGAAQVYAQQKGASPSEVILLDNGLKRLHNLLTKKYNVDLQALPGAGAAGGVGGGMAAYFNAELESGADLVFTATKIDEAIAWADVIITGEGKTDSQTLNGKLVNRLLKRVQKHKKRGVLICGYFEGDIELQQQLRLEKVFALAPTPADIPDAIANTKALVEQKIDDIFQYLQV